MIVNQFDAGNIFGCHDRGLPESLIGDHAGEMHNPVPHGDPKLNGVPFILFDGREHAVANVVVIGGWIRNVASEACDGTQEIGRESQFRPAHLRAARANV